MSLELRVLLTIAVAIIVGIPLGNGAVYFFNKMPGRWLTDYDEEPSEELLHPTTQRIKSVPYKYAFTGLFIAFGIYLGVREPLYAIPAVISMWLLLEMSLADIKYMIVPDQLIMLQVVTAIGFLPFHKHNIMDCLWGALTGFGIMLIIALISRVIYKKWALGGADIKLLSAVGLSVGLKGVLTIFVLSTFISAIHMGYLVIRKKADLKDVRAMVPYIAIATAFWYLFVRTLI